VPLLFRILLMLICRSVRATLMAAQGFAGTIRQKKLHNNRCAAPAALPRAALLIVFRRPIRDVVVTAQLAVGPIGVQIIPLLVMLTGISVDIVIAPGILGHSTAEIRLLPFLGVRGRFLDQGPKSPL